MFKKKLLLFFIVLSVIGLWQLKPILDISKAGFVPTPTPVQILKPLFSFSVIGDPESDLETFKKALAVSKNNGDEFTVIVGDLTHIGSEKELKEVKTVLEESQLKYYAVPGNHDLYSANKLTGNPTAYYQKIIGKPFDKVLIKENITLLLIDNSHEEKGISDYQLEFIEETLSRDKGKILIFSHIPFYHPESTYIMGYRSAYVGKQKDKLLKIFHKENILGIFSGHLHHTSNSEKEGIKFFVSGSVSSERNWQTPRFLQIKVFENFQLTVGEVEL